MSSQAQVKKAVHTALQAMGWDIVRYDMRTSWSIALVRQLVIRGIDTVLDVGANEGQYARSLREAGYSGRFFSFEPLESAHSRLMEWAARDPLWTVAPRMALGNEDGTLSINVSANSYSSSALPMLDSHLRADPASRYVRTEVVRVARLDTIAKELVLPPKSLFLKIDVQGFERQVLEGAENLMPRIAGAQLELSLVPLYEGQALLLPLIETMGRNGFEVSGFVPGLVDPATGRTLQVDTIFFRS